MIGILGEEEARKAFLDRLRNNWLIRVRRGQGGDLRTLDEWKEAIFEELLRVNVDPWDAEILIEAAGLLKGLGVNAKDLLLMIETAVENDWFFDDGKRIRFAPMLNRDLTYLERSTWGL